MVGRRKRVKFDHEELSQWMGLYMPQCTLKNKNTPREAGQDGKNELSTQGWTVNEQTYEQAPPVQARGQEFQLELNLHKHERGLPLSSKDVVQPYNKFLPLLAYKDRIKDLIPQIRAYLL